MQKLIVFLITISCSTFMFGQLVITDQDSKCGYCKEGNKNFIIPPIFDKCSPVINGVMIVTKDNKESLIDTLGNTIIGFDNDRLKQTGNLIEAYDYNKGIMLYTNKGEKITDDYYQKVYRNDPLSAIFPVKKNNKFGLMNNSGVLIKTLTYDTLYQSSVQAYFIFRLENKFGIIDMNGKTIHSPTLDKVNKISNDSIMVKQDGHWFIWSVKDSTYTLGEMQNPRFEVRPFYEYTSCAKNEKDESKIVSCSDMKLITFMMTNLVFPNEAKQARRDGSVLVSFTVDIDGSTKDHAIKSEKIGYGLEEAAIDLCKKIKFERPAMFEGRFVSSLYTIPIRFKL